MNNMKNFMKNFMLKKRLVAMCLVMLCIVIPANANNLLAGWDGNGITGKGSEPCNFGWSTNLESPSWGTTTDGNQYNQAMYRDYKAERYLISGLGATFYYPVELKEGLAYELSASFAFFDDNVKADVPFMLLDEKKNVVASTELTTVQHVSVAARKVALVTQVKTTGRYYIAYTNPNPNKRLAIKSLSCVFLEDYNPNTYDIIWTSVSGNSSESMPLGGGDLGCNVWAEGTDLFMYVQKSGSLDENNQYDKLGRIRFTLSPNPLEGCTKFRQQLHLDEGYIEIIAANDEVCDTVVMWVDVYKSVVHAAVSSNVPTILTASYESWRSEETSFGGVGAGIRSGMYGLMGLADMKLAADVIVPEEDRITFYHRNGEKNPYPYVYAEVAGMSDMLDEICDDNRFRTFGGVMYGEGFIKDKVTDGVYQHTPYKAYSMKSAMASKHQSIVIATYLQQTATIDEWKERLDETLATALIDPQYDFEQSKAWWRDFWSKSYIRLMPDNPDVNNVVWRIGRNYQLFRYQLGTNYYGSYPARFNGGNFTFDPATVSSATTYTPDYRTWGGGVFTLQNERLLFWPMLRNGDFEAMKTYFNMFVKALPGAKLRVQRYFGHDGAAFSEYLTQSGIPAPDCYGWPVSAGYSARQRGEEIPFGDERATASLSYNNYVEPGIQANGYVSYHFLGALEASFMALQYHLYTGEDISEYLPFIKQTLIFFDKHYRARELIRSGKELDDNGKLVIYPSSACETYRGAKNPADVVSGLNATLKALLKLDCLSDSERLYYEQMLSVLPGYAFGGEGDDKYIKPAWSWTKKINAEQPELYPLFPFNEFHIGDPEIPCFKAAYDRAPSDTKELVAWHHCGVQLARMGEVDAAKDFISRQMDNGPLRFPTFWRSTDWTPDHNWGGAGMIGMQEMLMQVIDDKHIVLFPAWPKDWDVDFKMHAPHNTVIEGSLRGGKLIDLNVTPASRAADVYNLYEQNIGDITSVTKAIEYKGFSKDSTLVYDLSGRLVNSDSYSENELSKGIYVTKNRKFVVK